MSDPLVILGVGDVAVRRPDPDTMFRNCRETLLGGSITFGQLETTISARGTPLPQAGLAMRAPPETVSAIANAGFDVMSFAGNHCLDWGLDAFSDTLAHMAHSGIRLCGAGRDIAAARKPVIMEAQGYRVAFLAYSSILPMGYWAEDRRAGCAPMRAFTHCEPVEPDQPGTPSITRSFPHGPDLEALTADIRAARALADIVILSLHWGIHMVRATIADYQPLVARAAIEAGADAIFGHHPHLLKGVEFHLGRPIFYSLGNFAIEPPQAFDPSITQSRSFRHLAALNPDWDLEKAYTLPHETRYTGIAKLLFKDGELETHFLPAYLDTDSAPTVLTSSAPEYAVVRDYLREINREAGFRTGVIEDGNEFILAPPPSGLR